MLRMANVLGDLLALAPIGSIVWGKHANGAFSDPFNSGSSPLLGGEDEPETLSYPITINGHIGADGKQDGQ